MRLPPDLWVQGARIACCLTMMVGLPMSLAACHPTLEKPWTGYSFDDSSEFGSIRIIGQYDSVDQCKASLLRDGDRPGKVDLLCGYRCPEPERSEIADCAKIVIVR